MRKDMWFAFIPSVFATVALGLSVMSNFWCETIAFESIIVEGGAGNIPTKTFGPFYAKELVSSTVNAGGTEYLVVGDRCVSLPDGLSKDAKWKTTQAFAAITAIIGGVMLFWTWISPCFDVGNRFWKKSGVVFIFCSFTQGLTLLFLQSNACLDNASISSSFYSQKCKWDWGTRSNISSVVFWFIAGILMLAVIPPAETPERPPPETQTVTYTENAVDGTVEETSVVKGTYIAGKGVVNNIDPKEVTPAEA